MSSESSAVSGPGRRSRFWWLRWVLLAAVVAVLAVEGVLIWPKLKESWRTFGDLDWVWIVGCIVAAVISMDSFAQVQRTLLRSAGVRVSQWKSLSVVLAANSISQTMPGGQVLAPAFTYRETRRWGATPVVASWQVVMSGLLAGIGLAVLGFGGAVLAGAKTSPFSVIFSVCGFVAIALVLQYLATHPESLESAGARLLGWWNQLRNKPIDQGADKLYEMLEQLRAVQLDRKHLAAAAGWSLFNWVADVACLAFACYAVGASPSIAGLMVAYAAGKAVGTAIPLLPGGIGVVDAVLVPALTSAGMPASDAITAVLLYRMISYVLIAVIGWVVISVRFRTTIRSSSDIEAEYELEREANEEATRAAAEAHIAELRAEQSGGDAAPRPAPPASEPDAESDAQSHAPDAQSSPKPPDPLP